MVEKQAAVNFLLASFELITFRLCMTDEPDINKTESPCS